MNILKEKLKHNSDLNIQQSEIFEEIIGMRGELTFELDPQVISQDALDIIFGTKEQIENKEFSMQFEYEYQARKHKKKRINKKWAKRYGYKKEIVSTDGWFFSEDATTGTVEMWRYGDKKIMGGRWSY